MSIVIISAASPAYSSADGSTIDCMVILEDGKTYPFTANANDPESHGQGLWKDLQAGTYGAIAPYLAPVISPVGPALSALAASDDVFIRCGKAGIAFPAEWQTYVAALRAIVSSGTGALPVCPAYPLGS